MHSRVALASVVGLFLLSGCGGVSAADFNPSPSSPTNDGGSAEPPPDAGVDDAHPTDAGQPTDATPTACDGKPRRPAGADVVWETQNSGYSKTLFGVWGSGCNDVYAIGEDGFVLHSTGSGVWQTAAVGSDTFFGLWASGPNDVYAVGNAAAIRHFDGVEWQTQSSATGEWLASIVGSGAKNVFISGSAGIIQHSTGDGHWTTDRPTPVPDNYIGQLWIAPSGAVYGAGDNGKIIRRWGAMDWRDQNVNGLTKNLKGVWGSGENDIYVVGVGGTLLHSSGNGTWAVQVSGAPNDDLHRAWGTNGHDVYVIGQHGTILHSTGNGVWTRQADGLTTANLYGVWGTPDGDVWAVGDNGTILHGR